VYQNIAILVGFMMLYSLAGTRLERTPVSGALVFVVFGLLAGPSVLGILNFTIDGPTLRLFAELTLAVVLFVDASHADLGVIRKNIGLLSRLLLIGLPLTLAGGYFLGLALFDGFTMVEIALLATMLAPTDAALGKPVVNNKAVPQKIRGALNFESGLNDGICVPILLLFLHIAEAPGHVDTGSLLATLLLHEIGIGLIVGLGVVLVTAGLMRLVGIGEWIEGVWSRLFVATLAITCFAAAQALGGSGLIASFTGGVLFGSLARRHKHEVLHAGEVLGETLTLFTWVFFGAAVVGQIFGEVSVAAFIYAVLSLTVVRMLPVFLALTGTGLGTHAKLFVGWFGPRGLASIVFAVMVVNSPTPGGHGLAVVVAITVVLSVIAHGLSAVPLAAAFGRREGS